MFVKITTSGPRRYVQLVESFRDENGRPKQRTVATLGRLDQLGKELESVIDGLLRVTGRSLPEAGEAPAMTFESARALGDVWALTELWNELGFGRLRQSVCRVPPGTAVQVRRAKRKLHPALSVG